MAKAKKAEAPASETPFVEGAEVLIGTGDAASGVYRDKAGVKLGGGPTEGASYQGTVAEQAIQSVEDFNAKLEKVEA